MLKSILLASGLAASTTQATLLCQPQSQPNPIAAQYPHLTTGTVNGTVAIIQVPLSFARSIVPAEYPLLTAQVKSLLPWFPDDMFPMMVQTELDYDVRNGPLNVPFFMRTGLSFPFVDRLDDGYTAFSYSHEEMNTFSNLIAELGTALYGDRVIPATYDPPCDPYRCADAQCKSKSFKAYDLVPFSQPLMSHTFTEAAGSPYPISFYKNITNQPQTSDDKLVCDNFIRLFNSSVTEGQFAPKHVKGIVQVRKPLLPTDEIYKNVWGVQMDNAFIENNFKPCQSLQGYTFNG